MIRTYKSDGYNWIFDSEKGSFWRWGKEFEDDPKFSEVGPEILDLEISTACHGPNGVPCTHCYKSNNATGTYMNLETFKKLLDKMPKNLTQIAFGIGDIDSNPDMYEIFKYCREKGIVPNVTINGARMNDEHYTNLATLCGAVAVSRYSDNNVCYNTVEKLCQKGLKQVNIHQILCKDTYDSCFELIDDTKNDPRLKEMYSVVFLMMKPKGNKNQLQRIDKLEDYKKLIDYAFEKTARIGFDSCFAPVFMACTKDKTDFEKYLIMVEPCESSLFSSYINVDGIYWHCSFAEGNESVKGVDAVNCEDFIKDVWFSEPATTFRDKLINQNNDHIAKGCRLCPVYTELYDGII
jgi:MoaA/NifB/PqqE/SkfB family radical SAM enzyme